MAAITPMAIPMMTPLDSPLLPSGLGGIFDTKVGGGVISETGDTTCDEAGCVVCEAGDEVLTPGVVETPVGLLVALIVTTAGLVSQARFVIPARTSV